MDFKNFVRCRHVLRILPCLLGKDRTLKKVSDAFRKTRVQFHQRSSSWRPLTECTRRFSEASETLFNSDPYRSIPISHGNCRSALDSCYVKIVPHTQQQLKTEIKRLNLYITSNKGINNCRKNCNIKHYFNKQITKFNSTIYIIGS